MRRRHFIALLITALLFASVTAQTFARTPSHQPSAADVVTTYFKAMNAGMKSGDFSALATVFASDATFTRSTPTVVLAYEHAGSPPLKVAGRCVHVFTVQGGKITSYDWAVFYPGVK